MTISVIYPVTFIQLFLDYKLFLVLFLENESLFLEIVSLFLENESLFLNLFLEIKKKLLWTEKCIWMTLFVKIITITVTSKVSSVTLCTM
jgi:hypothetical protein